MKKTYNIDYSGDTMLAAADTLFDDGQTIEALRILNRNAALNGNDEVSYFLYAEIYDELGLHDKAVHNLFKSLDYEEEVDPDECYKGLAVCYMNLGDKRMCSYYYSMYLNTSSGEEPDESMEDVQDFIEERKPSSPLRVVWPPEAADFSDVFDKGVVQAMSDDTKDAIETFEQIPEGNSLYMSSRMNIATCHMLLGEFGAAEEECRKVLSEDPDNMLALINMANLYIEKKEPDKARRIAEEKFRTYETDNTEEMYKMASVYCETGLHKDAYELFSRMMSEYGIYHLNVLFFRAVAAFNAQLGQEALDAINLMLDVYPVSVNALYTKSVMYQAVKTDKYFFMEYSFGLPDDLANEYMTLLHAFNRLSKTRAREIYKNTDILNVILWCFDGEFMENKEELQETALSVAVKIGEYDIVRDYLLERRIPNSTKIHAIVQLAERNMDESYGVVISDIMYRVYLKKLTIGRKYHAQFLHAYGLIVGRFAFMDETIGRSIAPVAENIYARMEAEDILDRCDDTGALAMAMYKKAGMPFEKISADTMCAILNTDMSKVNDLLTLIGRI
ncbi:MAG: tetratricopeptide repeat protein [Clostridia bacterium]|nr:tetratricopeptide repeat protein [Clostridia bacterium]